jgi:hypothetical protein
VQQPPVVNRTALGAGIGVGVGVGVEVAVGAGVAVAAAVGLGVGGSVIVGTADTAGVTPLASATSAGAGPTVGAAPADSAFCPWQAANANARRRKLANPAHRPMIDLFTALLP